MKPNMLLKITGFCLIIFCLFSCSMAASFMVANNCPYTIWPGTLAGAGTPQLSTTGFQLNSGQSVQLASTPGWSGRIWARTGCSFDQTGAGKCQTGDCGGKLECSGSGAIPPTSLFEITLGKGGDKDYYDVSLVDGYNLPLIATPQAATGGCNATGCAYDLNMGCPKELQVVDGAEANGVVACKSACEAFGLDQYCCSGEFANPTSCKPSFYSAIFKRACPRAYSYAFDDSTSIFTCKASAYTITFCPQGTGPSAAPPAPAVYIPPAPAVYNPPAPAVYIPPAPAVYAPLAPAVYTPPAPVVNAPPAPAISPPPAPAPNTPVAPLIQTPPAPAVSPPPAQASNTPVAPIIQTPPAPAFNTPVAPIIPAIPAPVISQHTYGEVVGMSSSSNILTLPMSIVFLMILNFL